MKVRGLYLITDPMYSKQKVLKALEGNVSMLQVRIKSNDSLDFFNEAMEYRDLTKKRNIPLIINDRVDIALAVDADGVHIGQDDIPADICRKIIPDKILGVSVNTLKQALLAEQMGADYLGVGAMFETKTKSDAKMVGLTELKLICMHVKIPIVCIGGINLDNINLLTEIGIDSVAIISDILKQTDPLTQVNRYNELLNFGSLNE